MNTYKPKTKHGPSHHGLIVWELAVELCQLCHREMIHDAELRNQAQRAAKSVALNIAEGAGMIGANRGRHFKIAKGSVTEVIAAYEIAGAIGEKVPVADVVMLGDRIGGMLWGLIRGKRSAR